MGKNNYGIYIFGDLWESYSDELTADAAKHSLQSIHPTWKIEVKKTTDGEYPEFIESEAAAKGRSLSATNKDRKYFNKNEEHEVRYAQKTGRFAQSYQPTGLFAAKGKHINPKVDELYEKAGAIFNANTGNYGNMEFAREDHYSDLMNLLDEIEVGYYKHSPDGDYQEELDSQGFTLTAKEAIENLSNYIDYIMDGYPNQAIFKVTMSGNTEVNQWNKVSKPYKHDVYVIATDKAQAESEALKIMAGTHPTQYGHKTIKSVMQGNVSLPIDGSKAKVHSVKQYANGGMAKDGKAWFKEGVEAKAPNDLGGWSKSRPATVRRRMAIRSRDQKLSKHKQYISAGRALQALANVTKDPDTRDVAKRDADYFFDEAKRFADGGRVFSSQEAFEKELLEYFMPESDGFSKQADENKPGVTNYWMHINHDDEQDTYVGYFDTNTNKGSMLEPTMGGAAKGTEIREGSAIKSADLFFQEGSSDKEYHLQIIELKEGGYVVNFQYGRRGGPLQSGTKTPEPVSLPEAEKIYEKLKNEKTNKGYEEAADGRSLAATNKDRKYFNKNEEHEVRYAEQTGRATQSYQKSGGLNNLFANNGKSFSSNVTATTPMTGNEAFLTKSINVMDKQLGREIKYDFSIAYNKDFNSVVIKETDYRNPKDPYTRSLWMPFEGVHALYSLLDKLVSESVYGKAESGTAISNEVDKLHIFNPKNHTAEQVGNITIIKSKRPRSHYASMIKEVYIKGEDIPANWISTSEFNLTDLNKWAKIHNVDVNDIVAIKMRDGGI
jgi:predicted DNA-binding WGR domain protein